ncbi:MAG: hypothetical protein JW955_19760 [Sedimentisphaerales bacterium]|nr:hypothetical protein [Sedimentisphaerales bacterium]
MSFRVLIIPEDPTYNGYILKPIVERMLTELGKPNADVTVLTNPKLNGYAHAISAIRGDLVDRYKHLHLWLFLPDGDRASGLAALETELTGQGIHLFCCAATPEVEAWLLAGHRDKLTLSWGDVRQHPHLKENVFEPFLNQFGDSRSPGGGRERLTRETLANYRGLLSVCPELADLEDRLRTFFAQST